MSPVPDSSLLFRRIIRPHRSGDARTLVRIMLLLSIPWTIGAMVFMAVGAWPVSGFFGLEVILLGSALWLNHRRQRAFETIGLTAAELTVERVDERGRRQSWRFQPQWLRLIPRNRDGRMVGLELRSHGRSLVIARFLPPDEIGDLAGDLSHALDRLRVAVTPA